MDLNTLLHHHQRALIDSAACSTGEARRWAGLSASFYAGEIARTRRAFGRDDPFTWSRFDGGLLPCG